MGDTGEDRSYTPQEPQDVVTRVDGEIDVATAPKLRATLDTALADAQPPGAVIADLTAVTFLGSVGISELIRAHQLGEQQNTPLRITMTPRIGRVLELAGVGTDLDITIIEGA